MNQGTSFILYWFRFVAILISVPSSSYSGETDATAQKDEVIVQAVLRLDDFDLENRPAAKAAVLRHLRRHPECDELTTLVERFHLTEVNDILVNVAAAHCDATKGVKAATLLVRELPVAELKEILRAENDQTIDRAALLTALSRTDNNDVRKMAVEFAGDPATDTRLRRAAIRAAGRGEEGKSVLLRLVREGRFPESLHVALAEVLLTSASADIREAASKLLVLPTTASNEPLPALAELTKMRGDATRGAVLFREQGTCTKCHTVGLSGKQVGPDLTEIGSKLARQAMFVSILDPNAAISFDYETHNVLLDDGRAISGILISETDDGITIRTAEGIDRSVSRSEIDDLTRQSVSMMPSGLAQNMTTQQLVDLVEYLMTLKKR